MLFIGFILGFLIGVTFFVAGQLSIEKEAIKRGIIKLNRKYYKVEKLDDNCYKDL